MLAFNFPDHVLAKKKKKKKKKNTNIFPSDGTSTSD